MNKEQQKEKAKAMIIKGATLSETSKKTGISRGTLSTLSVKEKLQEKRANYLNNFFIEQIEKITLNKLQRLNINTAITNELEKELQQYLDDNIPAPLDLLKRLEATQRIENLILEVDSLDNFQIKNAKEESEEKARGTLDKLAEILNIN